MMRGPLFARGPSVTSGQGLVETLARSFDITAARVTDTGAGIVLEGLAPCYQAKRLAGAAVSHIMGDLPVTNRLRVVPQSHRCDAALADAVNAALRARMRLAGGAIRVHVRDGVISLQGAVFSSEVRQQAEAVAWSLAGVTDVRDRIRVIHASAS